MKRFTVLLGLFALFACSDKSKVEDQNIALEKSERMSLNLDEAERLIQLPIKCVDTEYPNKLSQVIGSDEDLKSPTTLHPAFYGCFDWHSSVHGHWSMVKLAKCYPELSEYERILNSLEHHITKENIEGELAYFDNELNQGFERMYGWAWLLKLSEELSTWENPRAQVLSKTLQPLSELISDKVKKFLPKLHYPIRVGTHTNTAFAMTMIYDYGKAVGDKELLEVVRKRAKDFFLKDCDCPIRWEPSGYDFLSPCLEEADIMRRVLSKDEFKSWVDAFLPELGKKDFELNPGIVADRTDGHLVHLDGLNYSRAWCLYGIVEAIPEYDHLTAIANEHIKHSLDDLTDDNYEGGHWLASFAIMALGN